MYTEIERIQKDIHKKEQQRYEFSKSWIGQKKSKSENAREKREFLKWSEMM